MNSNASLCLIALWVCLAAFAICATFSTCQIHETSVKAGLHQNEKGHWVRP